VIYALNWDLFSAEVAISSCVVMVTSRAVMLTPRAVMVTSRGVMVTRYLGVILTSEVPFSNKVLFVACFYTLMRGVTLECNKCNAPDEL